jgi:predicted metalloprotease
VLAEGDAVVDIDDDAQLDTSQINDVRGRGGRLGGISPGRGIAVGGGVIITIIVLVLTQAAGGGGGLGAGLDNLDNQALGDSGPNNSTLAQDCKTGADAGNREDCRIVAYVNSIQAYWTQEFASRGAQYVRSGSPPATSPATSTPATPSAGASKR